MVKIYITGLDEPITNETYIIGMKVFFGEKFIQDPTTKLWYPVRRISKIEDGEDI